MIAHKRDTLRAVTTRDAVHGRDVACLRLSMYVCVRVCVSTGCVQQGVWAVGGLSVGGCRDRAAQGVEKRWAPCMYLS